MRQPSAGMYLCVALTSGVVLGLPFTLVGLRMGNDGAAAARMEGADHIGAAAGALLTGLVLLPVLGMTGTLSVFAGLKLISALLIPKDG